MSASNHRDGAVDSRSPGGILNPLKTGDKTVNALYDLEKQAEGGINFSGPVIPWSWIEKLKTRQGRTYWNAIMILSDIVFHYRANPRQDKKDGLYKLKKRFKHEWYHVNVDQCCRRLGVVPEVISRILRLLEKLNLIKRHYDRCHGGFFYQKNVFVELLVDELVRFTRSESGSENQPDTEEIDQEVNLLRPENQTDLTGESRCSDQKVNRTKKTVTEETPSFQEGTKNNINTEAAKPRGVDSREPSAPDQGASPPVKIVKTTSVICDCYRQWFGKEAKLPANWDEKLSAARKELGWNGAQTVCYICWGWLCAVDSKRVTSGFNQAHYTQLVANKDGATFSSLFKRDRVENLMFLEHIAKEVQNKYPWLDCYSWSPDDVVREWEEEMELRESQDE